MTTALIYDPIFQEHHVPDHHPERPQRTEMVMKYLDALNWMDREGLVHLKPRAVTLDELAAVHDRAYIQEVEHISQQAAHMNGIRQLNVDTYVSAKSYEAAIKAAGAPLTALDALMRGEINNAYCLVRPPGHHAVSESAFGFCIFNNIAVAARYAIDHYGFERVMIIDYDVHHGNGTQEMFYDDPRVLYFSVHQAAPFFPGTGMSDELGEGEAVGTNINVPLPPDAGFEIYEPIFRQIMMPAADRFKPQLILVSAGYDAHWKETKAETGLQNPGMLLSTAGFAKLNEIILHLADLLCEGRVIMVQEGGYDLESNACCAVTSINQLLGDDAAVDGAGPAPTVPYHINTDVLIGELRRIHKLTGYRMKSAPKPDIAKLRREREGPAASATEPTTSTTTSDSSSCCQDQPDE
ncbi:MAG TPA: histone deacetylase [Dictyobacter sp.]|jgi:acetoin utilization deacetylase AcuC-like enzyme|nr:histone deacetylase [Dictyobacter sp.]